MLCSRFITNTPAMWSDASGLPKRFRPVAKVAVFDPGFAAGVALLWLLSGAVLRFTLPGSAGREVTRTRWR